ncbi:hypothetical protein OEZ85_013726 [Tetradesmus obliquus]|uniref:BTB domain-containing protein n=1 Tax=Tetradesmus obliquus TaxID=3088 RepID=A0ABY8URR8_TETOB|nr:hypothetical protein OEZ85_013726 [Tetradesmus obliquus]
MSTGKRSFVEFAAGSEPNLTLITADGGRIPAHYDVLRLVCSCLRNAPANAVGFSRAVLTAVAELLRSGCVRRQLEVTLPFHINFADVEARMEMSEAAIEEAAGAAARAIGDLLVLLLQVDGVYGLDEYDRAEYGYSGTLLKLQEGRRVALQQGKLYMDHQRKQQLDEQLAAQLEALLYVGFKLDLPQLLAPALRFACDNAPHLLEASLRGGTGALFSQRPPAQAQASWLPQPVEATCACCEEAMFKDVVYKVAKQGDEHDNIRFLGTLTRDVYSLKKGTRVHVRLSGRGGVMSVAGCNAFRTDLHFGVDAVLGPPHMFGSR